MGQGRGSAIGVAVAVALLSLAVMGEVAMATEYVVGDSLGWSFNVEHWAHGKHFKAGDILVFNYPVGQHNVMRVNRLIYNTCLPSLFAHSYSSGMDRIALHKGPNYFVCGFPGHCSMGMKLAIHAM